VPQHPVVHVSCARRLQLVARWKPSQLLAYQLLSCSVRSSASGLRTDWPEPMDGTHTDLTRLLLWAQLKGSGNRRRQQTQSNSNNWSCGLLTRSKLTLPLQPHWP
jgi:hypothetical protein